MFESLLNINNNLGISGDWLFLVLLWTLPWKGIALWKASRNSHKKWFIVLLVVNTLAILEIIYILYFSKPKGDEAAASSSSSSAQGRLNK